MTLPGHRIQTLVFAVVVVALTLAAEMGRRRTGSLRVEYRARAAMWQRKTSVAVSHALATRVGIRMGWRPGLESVRRHETFVRRAEHARAMERKYRRAAERPWIPVAPDPSESK